MLEGFLLINKPVGLSSFGVVHRVRKISGIKKVGHAGTLDPFASGLLIVALGRAYTRYLDRFQAFPKTYQFEMILGYETDTLDPEGQITQQLPPNTITVTEAQVQEILPNFQGSISQTPPQFSAKKVQGQRAYKLARKGIAVPLEAKTVQIHQLRLLGISSIAPYPKLNVAVQCSKGTYIRSLVQDMGKALGYPATTTQLCRTAIGPYSLENATLLDTLSPDILPNILHRQLPDWTPSE